ncbi:MAG: methyltransferase domain-containing protein [Neisseriaceae bacterium]|nr:methyltransferase domain-containing protein [Neisseriaceae bacterium]MBP6861266.1 methyltransferase domain-containing protein [Neisseriaceae bacterium]
MSHDENGPKRPLSTVEAQQIAQQLACPSGELGAKAGRNMAVNNASMTEQSFVAAVLPAGAHVLEIGFGVGQHVADWLKRTPGLRYVGIEKSPEMLAQAQVLNAAAMAVGDVCLLGAPERGLPFANGVFDAAVTVNTVYFWPQPQAYLAELYRVLKPSGRVVITLGDKAFMQTQPFTQFGFTLYEVSTLTDYLLAAGFARVEVATFDEQVYGNANVLVDRRYHVVTGFK